MRVLSRTWLVALATAVCLAVQEFYPFSHFPMYSAFSNEIFVVYLTDGSDRPIRTFDYDVNASVLKKILVTKMRKLKSGGDYKRMEDIPPEEWDRAGAEVLAWLRANKTPTRPELKTATVRLWQKMLYLDGEKRVQHRERRLAESNPEGQP